MKYSFTVRNMQKNIIENFGIVILMVLIKIEKNILKHNVNTSFTTTISPTPRTIDKTLN